MQTYDLLMVLVLLGATVFGFWKGMAWQVASLASLVVSYFAALRFSAQLAPVFGQQAPLNRFAAMLAIYAGTSFFIWMMFRFVSGAIDKVRLESFDKQMGAIIGFAKGVLLCVAITFFAVTLLPPNQGEAIVSSQSGRYIVALLDKAHSVFPPEIHQVVDPYLNKIEQRLNPNHQPHAGDLQLPWQNPLQNGLPGGLPQISWPQLPAPQQQQSAWPQLPLQQQQPGWPATPQTQFAWPSVEPSLPRTGDIRDPYTPTEPRPFPGPYSAEVPASREY
jgi:membrane protein required for colicin V production